MSRLVQLEALLVTDPNEPFLLFAIAKEYEGLNDLVCAREFYERLQKTTPQYVGTYYHLGKLYERLDLPELALSTYRNGMTVAKTAKDMHAYSELAGAKLNIADDDDDDDF
jgi:tetratricopeptide (TPR) repeat protein